MGFLFNYCIQDSHEGKAKRLILIEKRVHNGLSNNKLFLLEIGGGHQRVHYGLSAQMSLSEIASQLGTSKTNLKRALAIERNLTEDMKDCLDKGVFSKTVAEQTDTLKQGSAFLISQNKE